LTSPFEKGGQRGILDKGGLEYLNLLLFWLAMKFMGVRKWIQKIIPLPNPNALWIIPL
jgi:hypothetical protein